MITGVHHFALTVQDMQRSLDFYCGLFGFEVISDREVERDYVEIITGVPTAHLRLVHLTAYGHRLELIQYLRPIGSSPSRPLPDTGSAHVCFTTDDIDTEWARLRAAGVEAHSPGIATTTSGPNKGGRGIYVRDPDGNAVEIVQLAPAMTGNA